jgi:hypothetical protein
MICTFAFVAIIQVNWIRVFAGFPSLLFAQCKRISLRTQFASSLHNPGKAPVAKKKLRNTSYMLGKLICHLKAIRFLPPLPSSTYKASDFKKIQQNWWSLLPVRSSVSRHVYVWRNKEGSECPWAENGFDPCPILWRINLRIAENSFAVVIKNPVFPVLLLREMG